MENRKAMENETMKRLKEIFAEIDAIKMRVINEPSHYISKRNEEYYECPGAYNDYMTRAMASDMFYFHLILKTKYPELADMISGWIVKMSKFNYRLMRMMDDNAGDRPMKKWNNKKTCKFVKQIKKAMETGIEIYKQTSDDMLKDFLERCKIWVTRIVYMNTWAFSLENMEDIEQTQIESQTEMYDNDGNKVSGLDENGRTLMKSICYIRRELTGLVLQLPVNSDDYDYVMDKLEMFNKMGHVIMETAEE